MRLQKPVKGMPAVQARSPAAIPLPGQVSGPTEAWLALAPMGRAVSGQLEAEAQTSAMARMTSEASG